MKQALILSLVFLLVGCNGKKKIALAWENELEERRWKGIPVKCPFCTNGWGYILEDESYDDPIYCIWYGQNFRDVYIDNDNLYWDRKDEPITIDERFSWSGFPSKGDEAVRSGDTLEKAMARLRPKRLGNLRSGGRIVRIHSRCNSQFTYNQSLDEYDNIVERSERSREHTRKMVKEAGAENYEEYRAIKERERNPGKSPEQIELEKITKELKELKEEVKKKK